MKKWTGREQRKRIATWIGLWVSVLLMAAFLLGASAADVQATVSYDRLDEASGWGGERATFTAPAGWDISSDGTGFSEAFYILIDYEGTPRQFIVRPGCSTPSLQSCSAPIQK